MKRKSLTGLRVPWGLAVATLLLSGAPWLLGQSPASTRVTSPTQHQRVGETGYPYRAKADYVLKELDLHPGDVVLDLGAGDGWWSEKMASAVGTNGVIYAAEIEQKLVDQLKEKCARLPQIRPHLCQPDNVNLPTNSCDLAFVSQVYHHLPDTRVDYLKHLRSVIKPQGRLCIIEKYPFIARGGGRGTALSQLAGEAEAAGWVLVRYELMTGTDHYLAILVQKDLFGVKPPKD
jgi:SAM-dependent methyltransferase